MSAPKDPEKYELWKKHVSEGLKGKKRPESFRLKMIGHPTSEETRKKIAATKIGKPRSEETRRKLSIANIGKPMSEKQKQKIRQTMKLKRNHLWKGGISFEPYCEKFDEPFKERVRAYFNYCCVECGTPQSTIRLAVHHVNFIKDSCCNQDVPKLFVPLCNGMKGKESCHSKTGHNRLYWQQHFTDMINQYYEGKCYFTFDEMNAYLGIEV